MGVNPCRPFSRHCERSEAIQITICQWIASGYRPRNGVGSRFLEVPFNVGYGRMDDKRTGGFVYYFEIGFALQPHFPLMFIKSIRRYSRFIAL